MSEREREVCMYAHFFSRFSRLLIFRLATSTQRRKKKREKISKDISFLIKYDFGVFFQISFQSNKIEIQQQQKEERKQINIQRVKLLFRKL